MDNDGVIRVGKTRVTLDTIVAAFTEGATAEEIALSSVINNNTPFR